ncbi:oxalate decarboxylase family bicupin [Spirosoma spitsbergense]|uniref:oxalate decarboxylase family bicupin n=1 Tax=Spirosoma spitsbergense TaxID=431554 RepID=UPI0003731ABB|nr:oxalate decarboxylase family bicupin [Spirosoma spitsbergense]
MKTNIENAFWNGLPQPQNATRGGTDSGPRDVSRDRENPDLLIPPITDKGTVPNLHFSFSNVHNRLEEGGWTREITARELPVSTTIAGINMRLRPGQLTGVRELHWHKQAEWAYMISGKARITAVDGEGRNFADDVKIGDLWYFPAGIPHSIQAHTEGCEFLLVFDDGMFSENDTFLVSEWLSRTPLDIVAKNFGVSLETLESLPPKEKYFFLAPAPPETLANDEVISPNGRVPQWFSYHLSQQAPIKVAGGQVKIVDSGNFPASKTIAAALVEVQPGGIRELHWHPNTDEWQYYLEGKGRMTVFTASDKARTFDFRAGDVGYVPFAMGHYVENTGDTPLIFLEIFRSDRFVDILLNQWLALTPPELVQAHLNVDESFTNTLSKNKAIIIQPDYKRTEAIERD